MKEELVEHWMMMFVCYLMMICLLTMSFKQISAIRVIHWS